MLKAVLVLEDGTVAEGRGFGSIGKASGELVFCTGMTGYVESLTDPSYTGQILMLTYPLIGNYGVDDESYESDGIRAEGLVVREFCEYPSPIYKKSIDTFLREFGVPGISGVDTRALTRKIRERGTMKCILQTYTSDVDIEALKQEVKDQKSISELNLVERVSTDGVIRFDAKGKHEIVLIDCGFKRSILRRLIERGINVTILPFDTPARSILEIEADGVMISNGPGDPAVIERTIENVKDLIGKTVLYGICLGHQIIAISLGAKTFKLKFGHRGLNQPVKDLSSGRVFISTQNHGFAVEDKDLDDIGLEVTEINLNDHTIEGLRHVDLPILSVQYHPEATPGPHDTYFFFETLMEDIERA
jgi:carbamoyl-phosphate synthase small subunit